MIHLKVRSRRAFALSVLLLAGSASPLAANYPNQPIKIIVPFAAGGGVDIVARIIAPRISEVIGQPVSSKIVAARGVLVPPRSPARRTTATPFCSAPAARTEQIPTSTPSSAMIRCATLHQSSWFRPRLSCWLPAIQYRRRPQPS